MNAVERMTEYTKQPLEGAEQGHSRSPPPDWPQFGAIQIDNLQVCFACCNILVISIRFCPFFSHSSIINTSLHASKQCDLHAIPGATQLGATQDM